MATINVRRLDEEVVPRLKQRAAVSNRSLESEARHILECAAADDLETRRRTFLDLVGRLQPADGTRRAAISSVTTPSEKLNRNSLADGHPSDAAGARWPWPGSPGRTGTGSDRAENAARCRVARS